MNNKTQLLNQVETEQNFKRLARGHEIYNNGLVSQIENDVFLIKEKYVVEDISTDHSPIYTCTCPDYQFRPEQQCKHIFATVLYQLEKGNGA